MKKSARSISIGLGILFLIVCAGVVSIGMSQDTQSYEMIMRFKGGFASVLALVDTYYMGDCFKFVPARVHLEVQGKFVFANGMSNAVVPGRTRGWVRSGPVFGFGPATMICEMYSVDSLNRCVAKSVKPAFLLGPIVIG